MEKYNRLEKTEIINKVTNLFMKEWSSNYLRYELCIEYKMPNGKIIEIETYDNEDSYYDAHGVGRGTYGMTIYIHDHANDKYDYESQYIIGRWWSYDYGDIVWKCDNTIKNYIRNGLNNIFRGLATEKSK